jgi:hypothetical protein
MDQLVSDAPPTIMNMVLENLQILDESRVVVRNQKITAIIGLEQQEA